MGREQAAVGMMNSRAYFVSYSAGNAAERCTQQTGIRHMLSAGTRELTVSDVEKIRLDRVSIIQKSDLGILPSRRPDESDLVGKGREVVPEQDNEPGDAQIFRRQDMLDDDL